MKPKAVKRLLLLFILTAVFCNGCWDKKEFNQLALAQNIAIDYLDNQYQVTLQLIMSDASEESISGENMWVVAGQGDSVGEALEQIALCAPRELYLGHLDIVLLGEGVLKHDMGQGMEYLLKQNVLRRRTKLLAVEGVAGDILQAEPKLADVDIFYLSNLLKDQSRLTKDRSAIVNDYYLAVCNDVQGAFIIPRVEVQDEKTLRIHGSALIQDKKLSRWVDTPWMHIYHWFSGGQEIVKLKDIGPDKDDFTVEIRKSKCRWELLSKEPLRVRANLKGKLYIVENNKAIEEFTLQQIEALNRLVKQTMDEKIIKEVEQGIAEEQQAGTDSLHLGRWLYAWHPDLLEGQDWETIFPKVEIEVSLETKIELYELK